MDRNMYAAIVNETVKWAKHEKEDGNFLPCIQMHLMSKIDGVLDVAIKDIDLSIEDFKWLSNLATERSNEISRIICDRREF